MATREELIQEAEQQWEREQLIKEAEAKYADEQESSSEMDEGAADDSAEVTGLQILEGLKQVTEAGAAPVRAGLAPVLANGLSAIPRGVAAMVEQIGEDADLAPTPMELAAIAGIPKDAKVPAPDLESGMAVSFTPEQVQGFLKQLGLGSGQATPSQVPAREVFATGVSQLDATPAIIGSLPTPAVKLPFRKQPLEILPAFEGSTGLLPQGLKAGAFGTAQGMGAVGRGIKYGYDNAVKPVITKTAELGGAFVGAMRGLPEAVKSARSAKRGAAILLKAVDNLPPAMREVYDSLKPEIRQSFLKHYATAVQNGIDVALVVENPFLMYGKDAFITKAKATMKGVGFEQLAQNWTDLNRAISNSIAEQTKVLSLKPGTQLKLGQIASSVDQVTAGEGIRKAFNRKVEQLFDETKVRYSTVLKQSPELRALQLPEERQIGIFNQLADLEEVQLRTIKNTGDDAVRAQAEANRRAILKIGNAIANNDLSALIPLMQQQGREAFTIQVVPGAALQMISPERKVKQNLYRLLQSAIVNTIEEVNPEIADALKASNAKQSHFFERSSKISDIIADEAMRSPERVYQALVAAGDSNKLSALRDLIGEEPEFYQARAQYLNDLVENNAEGAVIYNQVRKRMQGEKVNRTLSYLFTEGELDKFNDLLKMGADIGPDEFNPSRSGVTAILGAALSNPIEAIKAGSLGPAFVQQLESEAALQHLLTTTTLKDLKRFKDEAPAIYAKFGKEIEEAIRLKESDPAYIRAEKQLQKSNEFGPDSPIIGEDVEKTVVESTPDMTYTVMQTFLKNTFLDMGAGIDPGSTPLNSAYKTLLTIYNVNKQLGQTDEPLLIPETDREMVKQVIRDSAMNSIQQTRNLRSLNNTGYLLNLEGLKKEPEAGGVIRKLMGPGAMASPKKDEALAADKAGPIDKLGRNPASPGLRAESSLNDEP